jgi:hypothetical protein
MLPWSFSEGVAAEKYMAQLQHNMWVVAAIASSPEVNFPNLALLAIRPRYPHAPNAALLHWR